VNFKRRYPPKRNAAEPARTAGDVATELVGKDKMDRHISLNTGADDFASWRKRALPHSRWRAG
jgi:hypothetical protein